ncbi:fumarate hydratase [Candidatus Bathyarchaeota archaeon]|nr:fumarate hydratase [Candidatus Bathyarchaeota archaeon]MBL7079873.1 fumarate hydratase [Candidatus Bathyarchaeota archaeon]
MTFEKIVEDTAVELLRIAATELPVEYVEEIKKGLEETDGAVGRAQLGNILEDIDLAREGSKPMCQDTGIVAFMVKVGDNFPLRSRIKEILVDATRRATEEVPLRPNAVDMFKGNTRDNVGLNGYVPMIFIDMVPGGDLEIIAMPKGGGSTNIAAHRMLKPGLGWKGIKQFVIEALAEAGSLGCPPYFVGVGIGGGEDLCMTLAKKALLKPFKSRNENPDVAAIEDELLGKVNQLRIGAMGLGEGPTALDLHIELAARHPASLPVGVVISCWALRHARAVITGEGEVSIDRSA